MKEAEKNFGFQLKVNLALEKARLYGGSAMIMGVDQGKCFCNRTSPQRNPLRITDIVPALTPYPAE
jgi:hypothetical protein